MTNFTARKVFKQGYPGTENFLNDEIGSFPSGWTDGSGGSTSATIIAELDAHMNVLQLDDQDAGDQAKASVSYIQGLDTIIEFWITKDSTAANTDGRLTVQEGGLDLISLRFQDNDLDYFDGGFVQIKASFMTASLFSHIKLVLDDSTNTFDCYINGVLEGADLGYRDNSVSGTDGLRVNTIDAHTGYKLYFDALGVSMAPGYVIGDNVHWRHYKQDTNDFENQFVGDQGLSIEWLDSVNQADDHEIVAEFNEHKKILRTYQNSGTGDCYHLFASRPTTGWIEGWIKVADANAANLFGILAEDANIRIWVQIDNDRFEYDPGGGLITAGVAAVDDTWYHFKIQWYDDHTFDLWVDNVLYLDGVSTFTNFFGSGVNRWYIDQDTAGAKYIYLDAPICSSDSNQKADNRTFEYKPQTYDDITANLTSVEVRLNEYMGGSATIIDDTTITLNDLHVLRLYDVNGDLLFEGDHYSKSNPTIANVYLFYGLNRPQMNDQVSYTASAAEDINATLKGIHTNVGQENGRLIYYTEDDPAGNLTVNYRNSPVRDADRWLAAHGGKVITYRPNGVMMMDDDRSPINGQINITSATGALYEAPQIHTITTQRNRVLVRGAMDPDTGAPFEGVSEDTVAQAVSGIINYYKRFRNLQSDADCASRAAAIRTGTGFNPQLLVVSLSGIYALPGEIINFAFSPKSFSATNCYVESAIYNLVANTIVYVLNTGIFDGIGMGQPQFTLAAETSDDIVESIRATDITTIIVRMSAGGGGAVDDGTGIITLNAANDEMDARFMVPDKIDPSRGMILTVAYEEDNNDTDISRRLRRIPLDSSTAVFTTIWNYLGDTLPGDVAGQWNHKHFTLSGSEVVADNFYIFSIRIDENNTINLWTLTLEYFIKRDVST